MARKILRDDWDEYAKGDYTVVNNPWNNGNLVNGEDYTQTVTFDTKDLTRDVRFDWDWPEKGHVLAYPEIIVGYKPWGKTGTNIINASISDIRNFDVSHRLAIGGETGLFNVAYDLWLTDKPLGGQNSITTEVMIWPHKGGPTDFGSEAFVGTYRQGGTTFDIFTYAHMGDSSGDSGHTWRYVAFVPRDDILIGTVDVQDVLIELVERKLISEKDYVTGYEIGAEVTGGKGHLTVKHISHDFETYGADGGANVLIGTAGRDRLHGLAGEDSLRGGGENDFLSGGMGSDKLTGGTGADVFYFNTLNANADVISDFRSGTDKIGLELNVFDALEKGKLDKEAFAIGEDFGADTRILYKESTGEIFYDADGAGGNDTPYLIAVLSGQQKLVFSDFTVL
jgi:Ca2+-binding RTX toxin-like protein